jgi:hypothetical protein
VDVSQAYDRNGLKLEAGVQVLIQHVCGSYGQCRQVQGELVSIDRYAGITIRLAEKISPFTVFNHLGSKKYQAGDLYYCASVFTHYKDKIVGYSKFEDFEHGHEKWVEILK